MSKSISVRDLMLCEELSHIKNEVSLIDPVNDDLVKCVLHNIGFDVSYGFNYIVALHRCMQNKVGIGFIITGEMSRDRSFNKFLDAYSLTVLSGYKDPSLAKDMINLMGKSVRYQRPAGEIKSPPNAKKAARYENIEDDEDEFPEYDEVNEDEYVEPDYVDNQRQIKQLEELRDFIRGDNLGKGN